MSIVGRRIIGIKYAPAEDYDFFDGRDIVVIQLDNGDEIYAMQDEEGNGPGVMIHRIHDGITRDEYVE